ncbi:MAG: hypothetical protein ACE5HN_09330 [Nitrospiria bacterium]
MTHPKIRFAALVLWMVFLSLSVAGCNLQPSSGKRPRQTFFVGVDISGSFEDSGHYDDALTFLSYYIYGHLNNLGGLEEPRELFVGAIGGESDNEPKAFHPIHEFVGKDVEEIEADLRAWFPSNDELTDFNSFFDQVSRIAKERNLVLAPITIMLVSDGVPDMKHDVKIGTRETYQQIDFTPLEFLARRLTVRLVYTSPKVGDNWRKYIDRRRVRLWAVEGEVMEGWHSQLDPKKDLPDQERFWKWLRDNVDFRPRSA